MKRTSLKPGKGLSQGNKSLVKRSSLKSKKNIKNTSDKKRWRDERKKETYKKIDSSREHKCEGCGSWNRPLSHSHLISVGHNNVFEASEWNIRIHCMSFDGIKGCHEKWEDGLYQEITRMLDFEENMDILQQLDVEYYRKKYINIYGHAPEESI